MASSDVPLHSEVTKEQFASYLSQYPAVVEAISQSKGAKDGQKTLSELDRYRYVDAVETFSLKGQKREMDLDDVKMLVEWKLRHGKFRPTLMSLVSSNPPSSSQTIHFAIKFYANSKDAGSAIRMLSELKGIGPATASLLLSVHDADHVIFFSDEAYYWLCCGGKKESIKYTPKEYLALRTEADALMKRLDVSAVDVEKVAYVLMKQPEAIKGSKVDMTAETKAPAKAAASAASSSSKKRKTGSSGGSDKKDKKAEVTAAKKDATEDNAALRRSKRLRR
ncbi:hypothetical protein CCMA1212_009981 [Trichoderma ghanense]|uniref:Uncharacterized protein n=1 Tax=Trichoderma ghanense TaxID=65468 RepID=A0ABY2GSP0_9HYPO